MANMRNHSLRSLLDRYPDFDLLNFDFMRPDAAGQAALNETSEDTISALKALQRLLRIAPSSAVAEALSEAGFESAHQIATLPETQFVRKYTAQLDPIGGAGTAQGVHRQATRVVEQVRLHAMNCLALNEASFAASPVVSNAPLDFYNGLPSYEELFGSLNYAQCQDCLSILSPAAYFVDLMRLIDGYVTQPGNEQLSLRVRRPDLWTLPLTCESTNQEIPYLQIVNQVLEAQIKCQASMLGHSVSDPMAQLATAIYPFELPFNDALERVRHLLKHFNLSLAEIYADFLGGKAGGDAPISIAREVLKLSPEKYNVLTTANTESTYLLQAYGLPPASTASELSSASTFRQQTQLDEAQLENLLYQNLRRSNQSSENEINPEILGQFFINQNLPGGSYLGLAVDKNTDAQTINVVTPANETSTLLTDTATFDRLHRFIRLAQSLGWSFADTDLALRSIQPAPNTGINQQAIEALAAMSKLKARLGLQVDELCTLWSDINTFGSGNGKVAEDLFDRTFNYPSSFANQTGEANTPPYHPSYAPNPLYEQPVIAWTPFGSTQTSDSLTRGALRSALRLKDAELYLLTNYLLSLAPAGTTSVQLDVPELSAFYRYSRLARALNLPMAQFLALLGLLQAADELQAEKVWTSEVISAANPVEPVTKIVEWADWMRAANLNVAQLEYLTTGNANPWVTLTYNPNAIQSLLDNEALTSGQNSVIQLLASFFNASPDLTAAALNFTCQSLGLPANQLPTADTIKACGLNLYLAQIFSLNSQDLDGMAAMPSVFNLVFSSTFNLTLQNLRCIANYKKLCASFGVSSDQLLAYFHSPSTKALAEITGWSQDQITTLEKQSPDGATFDTVESVGALARCFYIAQTLHVDIDFVLGLRNLNALKLGAANAVPSATVWQQYKIAAQQLSQTVVAQYGKDNIARVLTSIQSACEELKRGVLASFLLWELSFTYDDIKTTNDLYDFLLIDVDMSSAVQISPLKAGLNSLQLYAQTTRLNLESGVTNHIPRDWWAWMSHYRVWQANREIYLYPENYVNPELREFKTPLFEELESSLQQGSLTPELVESALTGYLEGLATVANLEIVASYRAKVKMPGTQSSDGEGVDTVFLFGRTRTQPAAFYYRTLRITDHKNPEKGIWTPWEQINLTINAETITPVYAFNKLFVFWVEQTQKTVIANKDGKQQSYPITTADIKYSFQKLNHAWAPPQILEQGIVINVKGGLYIETRVEAPVWNQVRVLKDSTDDSIIVIYGVLPCYGGTADNQPHTPCWTGNLEIDSHYQMWYESMMYAIELQTHNCGFVTSYILPWKIGNTLTCERVRLKLSSAADNYYFGKLDIGSSAGLIYSGNGLIGEEGKATPTHFFSFDGSVTDSITGNAGASADVKYSTDAICPLGSGRQALNFTLNSGFVSEPISTSRQSVSAEVWIAGNFGNWEYTLSLMNSAKNGGYVIIANTGSLVAGNYDNSSTYMTADVSSSCWHHAIITVDAASSKLAFYVDGSLADDKTIVIEDVSQIIIGSFSGYTAITSNLANVSIWDRVLSQREVKERYEAQMAGLSPTTIVAKPLLTSGISHLLARAKETANQPGWFTFENGDEAFLVVPQGDPFKPSGEIVTITTASVAQSDWPVATVTCDNAAYDENNLDFDSLKLQFIRLTTHVVSALERILLGDGLDALLSVRSQYLPELSFNRFQPSASVVAPENDLMNFNGAYGEYFWELFFYVPFLIANTFSASQRFNLAQKWYQYIFDPTQTMSLALLNVDTDGLVSYWPLNGNAGDQIGGNDGTVAEHSSPAFTQTTFADGSIRTVFNAPGTTSSNSVSVGNPPDLNLTNAITLEGWCLLTSFGADDSWIIRKACDDSGVSPWNVYKLSLPHEQGHFDFELAIDGVYQNVSSSGATSFQTANLDEWYHVVGTYDGNDLKLYVNGELLGTTHAPGTIITSSQSICFGGDTFFGQLAELAIWNRALSQQEVTHRYRYAVSQSHKHFWRFRPFVSLSLDSIKDDLTNPQQIAIYEYDPFDPDAVARLRAGAYPKAIVMRYIANLLRWGNKLFAKYTWETLSEATLLYTEALDLLGPQPKQVGALPAPPPRTVDDFITEYGAAKDIPEFLVELENTLPALSVNNEIARALPFNLLNSYFCVPVNRGMLALWQEADNQLYKIRHGENIKGQPQALSLYGAPLNPMALAKGVAAGAVTSSGASGGATTVPYYRFSYLIQQAKELAGQVSQLGVALLGALEKQDAEQLAILLNNNEGAILHLTTQIKQNQIEQLQQTAQSLQAGLAAAQLRQQTYGAWLQGQTGPDGSAMAAQSGDSPDGDWTQSLSGGEEASLALTYIALIAHAEAGVMRAISSAFYLLPDIFGFADGGMNFGGSVEAIAGTFDSAGGVLTTTSQLISSVTQFQRREQDWMLQYQLAGDDIAQIQAQLAANQTETASAQQDLQINQEQITQNQAVGNFYQTKFTNQQLYQWMSGRLSTLYFQGYQLAFELAQEAQAAFQYENNSQKNFLDYGAWDSLEKGLTAADTLALSLSQLEKANIDAGVRHLEIEKTISLAQLDPQALIDLKQKGSCSFSLTEQLFDYDYPGHYNRKITTIALTIPAIVGPYQNLHATLTQTANRVVTQPDLNAVEYLLPGGGAGTAPASIRSNWNVNQEIAISRGVNDSGLFVLNFDDPRYLPFEGTGAISDWTLSMPQAANAIDFNSLSDVIIQLSYTAQDGGSEFRNSVTQQPAIQSFAGLRMLSLRQTFPEAWHLFKHGNAATPVLEFPILRTMFPVNLDPGSIVLGDSKTAEITAQWLVAAGDTTGLPTLSLNGQAVASGAVELLVPGSAPSNTPVAPYLSDFGPAVKNSLTAGAKIPGQVEDVILIIPFTGGLVWN